jgi:hypothetical protein
MTQRILLFVAALLLATGLAGPTSRAHALSLDFTDASYSGAMNAASFVKDLGALGTLTFTPLPGNARLYWDGTDGFGVQYGYENDEVEGDETLLLTFSTAVHLDAIHLTDLFYENGYLEQGAYALDGGTPVTFLADPTQTPSPATNGVKTLTLDASPLITTIAFTAPGLVCDNLQLFSLHCGGTDCQNHEFSVAGLDVHPNEVPEPATLVLLGSGLLGIGLKARRKGGRG